MASKNLKEHKILLQKLKLITTCIKNQFEISTMQIAFINKILKYRLKELWVVRSRYLFNSRKFMSKTYGRGRQKPILMNAK